MNTEKAFFIGVGFHYLMTQKGSVSGSLTKALKVLHEAERKERERVVDPYNRTVE